MKTESEREACQAARKPWIKICGLTDPDTALGCAALGADAIGLVFFDKSPRNVSMGQAAKITGILPSRVIPVGVFVNRSFDGIMKAVRACGLKGVQLHGNESPELVTALKNENLLVIKAVFVQKQPGFDKIFHYKHAAFILAEYGKGTLPGGNAQAWDYTRCRIPAGSPPLILAGGLGPENVNQAVADVMPAGVDVSSGVESAPGIKDLKKVARFIQCLGT